MIYYSLVENFCKKIKDNSFFNELIHNFSLSFDDLPSGSEINSWKNSLKALAKILDEETFKNLYIFLEYKMPSCSRRADVLLLGLDKEEKPLAIIIELKQWSEIRLSAISDTIAIGNTPRLHPAIQVKGYVEYLKYYHQAFSKDGFNIKGCVFLHNLRDKSLLVNQSLITKDVLDDYPLFIQGEEKELSDYLKSNFSNINLKQDVLDKIINPRYEISTKLLDVLVQSINSNFEWRLLDEQKVVFNAVIDSVQKAISENKKSVIIVEGGPGTGKSVLSIQLLAYAARENYKVAYATGSKAFITVLQAITQGFADSLLKKIHNVKVKNQIPVKDIFVGFSNIAKVGVDNKNYFDLIIGDEGHRLWDFRRNFYGNMNRQLSNTPMIEEIINSTKVLCIFLDENQTVRANEIGSVNYIQEHCKKLGIEPIILDLNIQFRCAGSSSYINFVDFILGLSNNNIDLDWEKYDAYDFQIFDDINIMHNKLKEKHDKGYKSRLVAGFCWKWTEPNSIGQIPHDIRIGDWSAPWIEKTERDAQPQESRYFKWARDDSYFSQVGSIYSVQGFEFDYIGLIFGNDLVIRNGQWIAKLENNKDNQFKKDLKNQNLNPLERIKNIYRVLLTRGMKGTYVYFIDEETKDYFLTKLNQK